MENNETFWIAAIILIALLLGIGYMILIWHFIAKDKKNSEKKSTCYQCGDEFDFESNIAYSRTYCSRKCWLDSLPEN